MDLSSARHAFITGGASGIGLGIADTLARRGISITIADIDREASDSVVAARARGFQAVALDVRDRSAWKDAKTQAEATFGPVDVLVNNAGIGFDGRELADMDPETFDTLVAVDLVGVFNGVSTFGADMRARGTGHIVNTASIMGLLPGMPTAGGYSAAKSGVVALSEALRGEMAPHGVGVSVLCPGLVTSNLHKTTVRLTGEVEDEDLIKGAGQVGMEPTTAGEYVARGISENLLYIITHSEFLEHVEARLNTIRESFRAVMPPA